MQQIQKKTMKRKKYKNQRKTIKIGVKKEYNKEKKMKSKKKNSTL